jgi:hypothetical protein
MTRFVRERACFKVDPGCRRYVAAQPGAVMPLSFKYAIELDRRIAWTAFPLGFAGALGREVLCTGERVSPSAAAAIACMRGAG